MLKMTCAFTGHRPSKMPWGYDETDSRCIALKEVLREKIETFVGIGVTDFFSGMAEGTDQYCSQIILDLRRKNPALKLHGVLPCRGQENRWSDPARERYRAILEQADSVEYISSDYYDGCMLDRNRRLVESAGYGSIGGGTSKNGGFSATLMCDHDRGYATGFVDFHDDAGLDTGKAANFLCENCLNEILPLHFDRCFGVGAIDLSTREVRIFAEDLNGFTLGDFYIGCDLKDGDGDEPRMHILVFYCPVRYEKEA